MANVTMNAADGINAKMARCFVTINKKRYNMFNMKNLTAKIEKKKSAVPVLGKTMVGHKTSGMEGTGSATLYYNTSIFRELLVQLKDSGKDVYFDIQIENDDPTSAAGKQTIILIGCNLDGGTLATFDASSDDPLEEDVDFTFEDFKMPQKFKQLLGM